MYVGRVGHHRNVSSVEEKVHHNRRAATRSKEKDWESIYPHPSHRPNLLYSRRVHSRPGFSSLSRSLPLSGRLVNDEPLDDRGRTIDSVLTLGGDAESGSREGLG